MSRLCRHQWTFRSGEDILAIQHCPRKCKLGDIQPSNRSSTSQTAAADGCSRLVQKMTAEDEWKGQLQQTAAADKCRRDLQKTTAADNCSRWLQQTTTADECREWLQQALVSNATMLEWVDTYTYHHISTHVHPQKIVLKEVSTCLPALQ